MKSVLYTLVVGSLMYAMVVTQPIIAHAVGVVSRYMHNLDRPHWTAMKNIFRYLVGTQDLDIFFGPNKTSGLVEYIDSDFADCLDSRKSTSGYFFRFEHEAISRRSKLQECRTLFTTEAAHIAHRLIGGSERSNLAATTIGKLFGHELNQPSCSDSVLRLTEHNPPYSKSYLSCKDETH